MLQTVNINIPDSSQQLTALCFQLLVCQRTVSPSGSIGNFFIPLGAVFQSYCHSAAPMSRIRLRIAFTCSDPDLRGKSPKLLIIYLFFSEIFQPDAAFTERTGNGIRGREFRLIGGRRHQAAPALCALFFSDLIRFDQNISDIRHHLLMCCMERSRCIDRTVRTSAAGIGFVVHIQDRPYHAEIFCGACLIVRIRHTGKKPAVFCCQDMMRPCHTGLGKESRMTAYLRGPSRMKDFAGSAFFQESPSSECLRAS